VELKEPGVIGYLRTPSIITRNKTKEVGERKRSDDADFWICPRLYNWGADFGCPIIGLRVTLMSAVVATWFKYIFVLLKSVFAPKH
jgi:hypothetical protein